MESMIKNICVLLALVFAENANAVDQDLEDHGIAAPLNQGVGELQEIPLNQSIGVMDMPWELHTLELEICRLSRSRLIPLIPREEDKCCCYTESGCCYYTMLCINKECSINSRTALCLCAPVSCALAIVGGAVGGCLARQHTYCECIDDKIINSEESKSFLFCVGCYSLSFGWPLSMLLGAIEGMVWAPMQLSNYIIKGTPDIRNNWHEFFIPNWPKCVEPNNAVLIYDVRSASIDS